MDKVTILVVVATFVLAALPEKQLPAKTAKQEFTGAVPQYLTTQVKAPLDLDVS